MTIIDDLNNINEQLVDATLDYSAKKLSLKEKEAQLQLKTDFAAVLNNKRPTVDDKKAFIFLQVKDLKKEVEEAACLIDELKRSYDIKKLESKMTGNFLNTIAGVVDDDD